MGICVAALFVIYFVTFALSDSNNFLAPDSDELCKLPANGRWCQVTLGSADFPMAVYNSADIVSNEICNTGTWELSAKDVTELGNAGHALDIGTNVGFYSFVLAAHGWSVTAFEPMSANHELLDATMCKNPALKQMIMLNKFGLGAKDDHCIIISDDNNLGDGISQCGDDAKKPIRAGYHQRATMDIRRLDDVLTEEHVSQIDFVKMDVEGFECHVMEGGQSLLTKFRPRLIQSEVWHDMQGCLPQDYLSSFAKASYSVTNDRECTTANLTRPAKIENRYMCQQPERTGMSLLEAVASLEPTQRKIVWLTPNEHVHTISK
jgi:FkbM family methyltransferase